MPEFPNKLKIHYLIWLPTVVFLIGLVSIALLLLTNRINERRLIEADIVDAIMDVQILVATAHLWAEEVLSGDESVEIEPILENIDQAINLIEVTLKGGASQRDWIYEPIQRPEQRNRAQEIQSLLFEFKRLSLQRLENPSVSKPGSVADAEYDALFKTIFSYAGDLERLMEINEAKNEEDLGRLFPLLLLTWAFIIVMAVAGLFFLEGRRVKFKKGLMQANTLLQSQAVELVGHRERLDELVAQRTAEWKATHDRLQVEMADRLHTLEILHESEKQNRLLSNKLLNAQETERKRISMEIHDELGQSLNVIKLQLRAIEKGSGPKGDAWERLLDYLDQVIKNVRRISMDLSPSVLEDLGLSSALQWLTNQLKKDASIRIKTDIEQVDHLVPRKNWIIVYRVVQEALTNILKHADAGNVSLVTRTEDKKVLFEVDDDGNGFEPENEGTRSADAKGLGLTTMNERVKIMGGDYNIWSRKGSGTRITFSIPIENTRFAVERISDHTG
jgi:signal transduction histidine kinase